MRTPRRCLALLVGVALIGACGSGVTATPASGPPEPSLVVTSLPTADGVTTVAPTPAATNAAACLGPVLSHQAPELEALLPREVAGRTLTTWSLVGRCLLEATIPDAAAIDELLAMGGTMDLANVRYALAGRTDTRLDPPYLVMVAARPLDIDEKTLNVIMLLGGAGFVDIEAATELEGFEELMIGGKPMWVGSVEMLTQDEHQRGEPYFYQTDDAMFIVITDDPSWAEEAGRALP